MFPPERIVCLTEETVETLYLLGEDARIVGVSGYAPPPPLQSAPADPPAPAARDGGPGRAGTGGN